jgi:hypothetical protein
MKTIQFIISLFVVTILTGCAEDSADIDLNGIGAPSNISAVVSIKQDNSGTVTFSPIGEGVSQFEIYYADGTVEPGTVGVGGSINHTYPIEGVYKVKIVGITVNGQRTEVIQELTVSFLPPTDIEATIDKVVGDSFSITVKAKANLETYFQVYFGDVPNEVPTNFKEGETIAHKYAIEGTYQVRVVAKAGGTASTEKTYPVKIEDIKVVSDFPIDFEKPTKITGDFGRASTITVANPYIDAKNSSTTVGACTKSNGSEVWGGSFITLPNPINFTTLKKMKMKVWSPRVGMPVLLKVENLTSQSISKEVIVPTTVAGAWETMTFDFTTLDITGKTYQKVVFIFDNATVGNGSTFYFDDIDQSN